MATKEVLSYSAFWSLTQTRGAIVVEIEKGKFITIDVATASELQLCIDMLRNEKPVYFETVKQYLRLGREPVGEGEWSSE